MLEAYSVLVCFLRVGGGVGFPTPEEQANRFSSFFLTSVHAARLLNRNLKDIPLYRWLEDVH